MRYIRESFFALASFVLVAGAAAPAQAGVITPAVQYTTITNDSDTRPFTLGYSFSLSGPVTVNALGVWDDGFGNSHQVGIWNSSRLKQVRHCALIAVAAKDRIVAAQHDAAIGIGKFRRDFLQK